MKVFLHTIGCKLNQFETEAIAESLKEKGFTITKNLEESDIVIINSCTVTDKADAKSRQTVNKAKKAGKFTVITGCYATTDFDYLRQLNIADMVLKNDAKFSIPDILSSHFITGYIDTSKLKKTKFPQISFFERTRAFVKIQDGCNKFCSYCKVPFARGISESLNAYNIIESVNALIKNGYKEIVLTGVNISAYNEKNCSLFDLVCHILKIKGEFRIRLSSLQPDEFDIRFIELLDNEKFSPHFHLSLQSGSDSVLKRMNRNYTSQEFVEICNKISAKKNSCGITTDIIVGFPLETDEEFKETLEILSKVNLTRLHIFPYSRRKNTKAASLKDMPYKIKKEREKKIIEEFTKRVKNFIEREILGKPQIVLIEQKEGELFTGYTGNYFKIYSKKNLKENQFFSLTPLSYRIKNTEVELFDFPEEK
ncbi:MAG: tRNA (N(6)-L-threonylcarbamoyladenosine(37)-C(2))-methylthiotransferase MtaB [Brevinematia bacterium]